MSRSSWEPSRLSKNRLLPTHLYDNVLELYSTGHAHQRYEDSVSGEDCGLVILGEAIDDGVVCGGDLEEVARLEALEAALCLGGDTVVGAVVVLNGTTDDEIIRLVSDREGEPGKGEGDLLLHRPLRLDVHGWLCRRGCTAAVVV